MEILVSGDNINWAIRKLQRWFFNSGLSGELKRREAFISKPEMRKRKHMMEMKRQKKQRQRRIRYGHEN